MAHLLGAEGVSITFGTRTVLEDITLGIDSGERIGIVGRNGDGKSTLMHILGRSTEPDSGRVTWRGGVSVGQLNQQDLLGEAQTIRSAVLGDAADHQWATDPLKRDVAQGLLGELDWEMPVTALSGGQRRRVSLAALLMAEHEVIMLDEPNNSMSCSFRAPRFYRSRRAASRCRSGARQGVALRGRALTGVGGC